ncbi:hypothetical protein K9L05_03185 [Candidatus Babeliales bacterium]|nr:hypothetical protein [Candidatus Babeliales bacterium]MCF7899625.1 hypothetical protein [Candidatus Babeliales bacterium]
MNLIKKILISILLGNFTFAVKPISENSVKSISVGSGILSGLLASGLTYNALTNSDLRNSNIGEKFITGVAGVGTGTLVGFLLYSILNKYTPKAKFAEAKEIIDFIEKCNVQNCD